MQNSIELFDLGISIPTAIFAVIIPMVIVQFVLFIVALISLLRKKGVTTGDKVMWLLIILFVNTIGPILYFVIGSSHLDQKAAEMEDHVNEQYQYHQRSSDSGFN